MNEQIKTWIDSASYEQLLHKVRFAPIGDMHFQGETGDYFFKVMEEKKKTCDHVQASKNIGWN